MGLLSDLASQNHTCPAQSLAEDASQPFIRNISFYQFNMILSGSCTAISCVLILVLMAMHATHLSKPNEQIKIMRIATVVPVYAMFSFLSICFPNAYVYLLPWATLFQALALGNFFLLLCEFVSPSPTQRAAIFTALYVPRWNGRPRAAGLKWFRRKWMMAFQYSVVALIVGVTTDVTQAANVYCLFSSSKPYFAHLWMALLQFAAVFLAVFAVITFYRALRSHLSGHRPLAKLFAFKIIVLLTFIQSIAFWALRDNDRFIPSSKFTFADLNVGLPNLIICIEMVPISIFFHYAFHFQPYIASKSVIHATGSKSGVGHEIQEQHYHGGAFGMRAWAATFNPIEILRAIGAAFRMVFNSRKKSDEVFYGANTS